MTTPNEDYRPIPTQTKWITTYNSPARTGWCTDHKVSADEPQRHQPQDDYRGWAFPISSLAGAR
jgi:hypothetical protein